MKLQDQVCTLEQAKKLKQLGVNQDGQFSWCGDETPRLMDNAKDGLAIQNWVFVDVTNDFNNMHGDWRSDVPSAKPFAAAFTVSELGRMIGKGNRMSEAHWQWLIDCVNSGCSGTIGYDPVCLAGFIITYIENHPAILAQINERLGK